MSRTACRYAFALALSSSAFSISAETIGYAIYEYPLPGISKLLAAGERHYRHGDVLATNARKELVIAAPFSIGTSADREPKLDGFGLWMARDGRGFSWEWFDRESEDVFRKLQGDGRVKVRVHVEGGLVELAEIEFLDDIALRLNADFPQGAPGTETHRLVVKAGSVLWLTP